MANSGTMSRPKRGAAYAVKCEMVRRADDIFIPTASFRVSAGAQGSVTVLPWRKCTYGDVDIGVTAPDAGLGGRKHTELCRQDHCIGKKACDVGNLQLVYGEQQAVRTLLHREGLSSILDGGGNEGCQETFKAAIDDEALAGDGCKAHAGCVVVVLARKERRERRERSASTVHLCGISVCGWNRRGKLQGG